MYMAQLYRYQRRQSAAKPHSVYNKTSRDLAPHSWNVARSHALTPRGGARAIPEKRLAKLMTFTRCGRARLPPKLRLLGSCV